LAVWQAEIKRMAPQGLMLMVIRFFLETLEEQWIAFLYTAASALVKGLFDRTFNLFWLTTGTSTANSSY